MSAKVYTLFSSSKGNSAYVINGSDEFLIDCGASAKGIEQALSSLGTSLKNIKAVFITHEHSDHISGLRTIEKYYGIPVYAPAECISAISHSADIPEESVVPLKSLEPILLSETAVCPVATPHDSVGSVGFRIKAGEERIGYFTDIGHLSEGVLRALSGCKRVIIESNHDINMLKNGKYPQYVKERILSDRGHLSNSLCARLLPHLAEHGTESFVLAHLSRDNNLPSLAYSESKNSLENNGIKVFSDGVTDADVRLAVAPVCGIAEL